MTSDEYILKVENLAEEKSKISLELLAFELNTTREELEGYFLFSHKKEIIQVMEKEGQSIDLEVLRSFQETLRINDYWEIHRKLRHRVNNSDSEFLTRTINENVHILPINWGYVHGELMLSIFDLLPGLATSMYDEEKIIDPLETIFRLIPRVGYFNLDFNIFLTGNSKILGLPGICIYNHLYNVVTMFIDNVAWLMFMAESSDEIKMRTEKDIDTRLTAMGSFALLHIRNCLNALLCRRLICTAVPFEYHDVSFMRHIEFIQAFGCSLIKYHEYGHLLMGHIKAKPSKKLEYNADRFANLIQLITYKELLVTHRVVGQTIIMFLLHFREEVLALNDENYPRGKERLNKLMDVNKEEEKILSINVWNKLTDIIIDNAHEFKSLSKGSFKYE